MLFSLAFIAMFVIGGLSGVTHSIVPADTQQHDSYYVVAHFHYVLFGGAVFGFVAGAYYWFPKWTGRMMSEGIGKLHFWLMLIGFNLTFGPQHLLGLDGMPRRTYRYAEGLGWDFWNLMSTIGAFTIGVSFLVFAYNVVRSYRHGAPSGPDPWDGRTLEWSTSSPPPMHNFDEVPVVHHIDDFWHRKYGVDEEGRAVRLPEPETRTEQVDAVQAPIHMPSPSFYPIVSAFGVAVTGTGLVFSSTDFVGWGIVALGVLTALWGFFGWAAEPITRESH
jgi:cytochrome c oxidase subunit 1